MKVIKSTLLLSATMFYVTIQAHPFSSNPLLRRFGPNSYITRIPLYFKKESSVNKKNNKKYKKLDKNNKKKIQA